MRSRHGTLIGRDATAGFADIEAKPVMLPERQNDPDEKVELPNADFTNQSRKAFVKKSSIGLIT
jgi:hypothetical protein